MGTVTAGRIWLACLATILAVFAAKVVLSHPALFVWAVFVAVFVWALAATVRWFTWAERAVGAESVCFGLRIDLAAANGAADHLEAEAQDLHLLLAEAERRAGLGGPHRCLSRPPSSTP
jgi:hypothetical protein